MNELSFKAIQSDEDIFAALGISEEWENDELADQYAEEDARTLKEYGF